jgi:hypothetical protein
MVNLIIGTKSDTDATIYLIMKRGVQIAKYCSKSSMEEQFTFFFVFFFFLFKLFGLNIVHKLDIHTCFILYGYFNQLKTILIYIFLYENDWNILHSTASNMYSTLVLCGIISDHQIM